MPPGSESACRVLVFTRTPVPGRVKTRLIPAIGAERAANLHRAMLWRTVATAREAALGPVDVCCMPVCEHPYLQELASSFGVGLCVQDGGDLGERMHRALASALAGGRASAGALLVGTDCPFLESGDLRTAATALVEGADAVIGPARDGGYYLIGVKRSDWKVFRDIEWGSERVLDVTRGRFETLGWQWRELETRSDVDRPEDLDALKDLMIF